MISKTMLTRRAGVSCRVLGLTSAEARPIAEVKLLGTSDSDRQNEMLDRFKRIYK